MPGFAGAIPTSMALKAISIKMRFMVNSFSISFNWLHLNRLSYNARANPNSTYIRGIEAMNCLKIESFC